MKGAPRKIIGYAVIATMLWITPWPSQKLRAQGMEPADAAEAAASDGPAASEGAPSWAEMAVDFTIARPVMLAATLVGTGFFLASLPVSLMGGNVDEAAERLVVEPATYTFNPCLGCLPTVD